MVVGDNRPTLVDQESGANALSGGHGAEEVIVIDGNAGDVHHRPAGFLVDADVLLLVRRIAGCGMEGESEQQQSEEKETKNSQ